MFAAGEDDGKRDAPDSRQNGHWDGDRYLAIERDANEEEYEEGLSDHAPLLSERPEPQYPSTKAKMLAAGRDWRHEEMVHGGRDWRHEEMAHGGRDWRHEAPLNSELLPPPSAWPGGAYPAPYASPDASRYYGGGGMPGYATGYATGISGRGVEGGFSSFNNPYGGRQADFPYGDPYGGGYGDPYGGSLVELAPMPLLSPPPQYMPSQAGLQREAGNFMRPF